MTAISSRRGLLSGCSTFLTSSGNGGASEELGYVQNVALRSHCLADAAAGIALNDEKFGMLYGNHIRGLIRRRTGLSRFQGITC